VVIEFGQFLEVLISGLLAGVLYSLVALGFVLIAVAIGINVALAWLQGRGGLE